MNVQPFASRLAGHAWTVVPAARDLVLRPRLGAARADTIAVVDDRFGPTALGCDLAVPPDAADVVVLVHGLGGHRRAAYVQRAARTLHRAGFATLALDLRGADRRGGGFYHVGLAEDLAAACRSPLLAPFRRVFVLGFSMGGHTALHFAARDDEPRLQGIAALCTPLDLHAAQRHVDSPACAFYRRWVLRGLQRVYAAVARRHAVPSPVADVWRCRTIHAWDTLAIAPRYGLASPEHFYARWSAARVLPALRVEAVLVLAQHDPVVPPHLALPWVGEAPAGSLRVCVLPRGGHLQFPRGAPLGLDEAAGNARDGRHDRAPAGDDVVSQLARHWRAST